MDLTYIYKNYQTFITSDEHYGHLRIISLAKRPFTTLEQMRDCIIENHNKKVPKDGFTIHVGDMFWSSIGLDGAFTILEALNGIHGFLFGNHDELIASSRVLQEQFEFVIGSNMAGGSAIIFLSQKKPLTLNHFSQRTWHKSHVGGLHVFGHSHNSLKTLGKSFDIGVDGNNFYPWAIEKIEQKAETLPQHHIIKDDQDTVLDI